MEINIRIEITFIAFFGGRGTDITLVNGLRAFMFGHRLVFKNSIGVRVETIRIAIKPIIILFIRDAQQSQ